MTATELKTVMELHAKWCKGTGGNRANLSGAHLSGAHLSEANLSGANLSGAHLSWANLSGANLSGAHLSGANLSGAHLSGANLSGANLSGAHLSWANLSGANLSGAHLSEANLSGANLSGAHLSGANLSGANGLADASSFFAKLETDPLGYIVYKAVGNTEYTAPARWVIAADSFLTEVCNPSRTSICGCGVNFGTFDYVKKNYPGRTIWKCRIHWVDLPDVCVPYHTDGKARCAKLQLIRTIN